MNVTRGAVVHALVVPLGYGLLYCAFFGIALSEGRVLAPGDASIVGLPHYLSPPSPWTTLLYAGYPSQADPVSMAWYPLANLLSRVPHSWNAFLVLGYVMASSFCYGYVHRITSSRLAATVSGLVIGLNSFAIAHLGHTNIVHCVAWAPLIIWALEELWRGGGALWGAVGSLAVANCLLAGHPQIFAYVMLVVGSYWLYLERWVRSDRSIPTDTPTETPTDTPTTSTRPRVLFLASIALGIGLGSVLLFPMLELANESVRVAVDYGYFVSGSLRVLNLPQLVFPYIWGGWQVSIFGDAPRAYFGRGNPSEIRVFLGVLPLLLVIVALSHRPKADRTRFWIFIGVAALLLALGRQLQLIAPFYWVPGYNRFRIPARHLMEFHLALSILCGLGIAALEKLDGRAMRKLLLRSAVKIGALACLAVFTVTAVVLSGEWDKYFEAAGVGRASVWPWRNATLAIQAGVAALSAAALWYWTRSRARSASFALCAAVVIDLACYGWLAQWRNSPADEGALLPRALAPLREELLHTRQRMMSLGVGLPREAAAPNRNVVWRIPNASGVGPLILKRYADFARMDVAGIDDLEVLSTEDRALDLLAVRYLMVPPDPLVKARGLLEGSPRWRFVRDLSGTMQYENLRALPRGWLVGEVLTAEPEAVLEAVQSGRLPDGRLFEPDQLAFSETAVANPPRCGSECGSVELISAESTRMAFRVRATEQSFLVVSDVIYPGWKARINGERVPLYRSNYVLRGISVPSGVSDVEFSFESNTRRLGAILSGMSAIVLVTGTVAVRRAERA